MSESVRESLQSFSGQHCGFLVNNIAATTAHLGSSAGIQFLSPKQVMMRMENAVVDVTVPIRFVYSADGGTELIEMNSGAGFTSDGPVGFHHMGAIAADRLDTAVAHQEALGAPVEWRLSIGGTLTAVLFAPTEERPVRFELLAPHVGSN